MEFMKEYNATIRHYLAGVVGKQMRKVPELQFFLDASLDYSAEIDRLLKK